MNSLIKPAKILAAFAKRKQFCSSGTTVGKVDHVVKAVGLSWASSAVKANIQENCCTSWTNALSPWPHIGKPRGAFLAQLNQTSLILLSLSGNTWLRLMVAGYCLNQVLHSVIWEVLLVVSRGRQDNQTSARAGMFVSPVPASLCFRGAGEAQRIELRKSMMDLAALSFN